MPAQANDTAAVRAHRRVGELVRLRWAVRGVLAFGLAASIAANVLHARPDLTSQVISAWPPLSLLLTVELVSRVPVHRWWRTTIRVLATSSVAGIAAWVSYGHMAEVARRFGVSLPKLQAANPTIQPRSMKAGQTLNIPSQ